MTFQPILPIAGFAGYKLLQRTLDTQQQSFNRSAQVEREVSHFRETIGKIRSAEALVADRTLMKVALGAFGLEEDLPNKYFIQKVLESNTQDQAALANRLGDKRYLAMAQKFDLANPFLLRLDRPEFADEIVSLYQRQSFEVAVGEQQPDFRLALGFGRELNKIIDRDLSADAAWFAVMGTQPVRRVFEIALGLPTAVGALDLDQQLDRFRARAEAILGAGEVADFSDTETQEELTRLFLLKSEAQGTQIARDAPGSIALTLLQGTAQGLLG